MMEHDAIFFIAIGLSLCATGVLVGIAAGLLGLGGGIIIVPAMLFVFEYFSLASHDAMFLTAIGTSLAIVMITSLMALHAHHKQIKLDFSTPKHIGIGIVCGATIGSFITGYINQQVLVVFVGIVLLLLGISMLSDVKPIAKGFPKHLLLSNTISSGIGFVMSLCGLGGGQSIPILTMLSYPIHKAIGIAPMISFLIAVPATSILTITGTDIAGRPPYSIGYAWLPAVGIIVSISFFTIPYFATLTHRIHHKTLKMGFGLYVIAASIKLVYTGITTY